MKSHVFLLLDFEPINQQQELPISSPVSCALIIDFVKKFVEIDFVYIYISLTGAIEKAYCDAPEDILDLACIVVLIMFFIIFVQLQ